MVPKEEGFLSAIDFKLGQKIMINKRDILLIDCDQKTREWYQFQDIP